MKILYAVILAVMEMMIIFTISRIMNKANRRIPLAKKARDMLIAAFFTALPNIILTLISTEWREVDSAAVILFDWYFIAIDITLFLLLYFNVEYAQPNSIASQSFISALISFFKDDIRNIVKREKQKTSWFEKAMILLFIAIGADVFNLLSNIWTGNVFSVERFYFSGSFFPPDVYFRTTTEWSYDLHLTLCYLMVVLNIVCLLAKTVVAPSIYKVKYFMSIVQILIIVLVNGFYILFALPVDFSVLLYGLVCVSMSYFAFSYIPSLLQQVTLKRLMQEMNNGIAVMDTDEQCIYANDYIRNIYRIKQNQNPTEVISPIVHRISGGVSIKDIEPKEETIHRIEGGKDIFYKMHFSKIETKDKKYIGSYLMMIDTTEENNREKLEHFRSTHDPLTGLYNKNYFYEKVADMLEANPDEKYFIVCCDVGKFKLINEFNGIAVGDKILKSFAEALKEKTVVGEIYGRIDNDRFAILIPKDRLNLQIFIDGAQQIFKETVNLSILPTCYFGVYEIEDTDMRVSFMCDRAFIAIDTIKGQYGKQVAWYDSKLRDSALREQELVYQLPEAISTGQIKIYLQPQSTIEGKAVGAEALVRWEHPDEGVVSPSEFIPIFEKNGMITKIDRYVWRLVFQKLFEWKTAGRDDFYISVNISPKDFYLMSILNEFTDLLKEFNVDPKNLHIELSEDVMMGDLERQIRLIEQLHKIGFTIEIGDFGAGNTSLKILRECNIDILKVDIGFLQNTKSPRNAHIIMKELISMAKNLGIKILAKGIEAKDQMDLLHEEGCDLFQGYYFSKPIDTKSFERIYL